MTDLFFNLPTFIIGVGISIFWIGILMGMENRHKRKESHHREAINSMENEIEVYTNQISELNKQIKELIENRDYLRERLAREGIKSSRAADLSFWVECYKNKTYELVSDIQQILFGKDTIKEEKYRKLFQVEVGRENIINKVIDKI